MADRVPTGIAAIDEAIQGGLPLGGSVVLQGPSGGEKLRLALTFLAQGLKAGSGGLVVVTSQSAERILAELRDLDVDLDRVIAESRLRIIDRFPRSQDTSHGTNGTGSGGRSPIDPTELSVALSHAIATVRGQGPKRAVVEALSYIAGALGPTPTYVFAHTAKSKFDRLRITALFVVETSRHSPGQLATLHESFDGVIDIKHHGEADAVVLQAQVLSMKGGASDPAPRVLEMPQKALPTPGGGPRRGEAARGLRRGKAPCPACEAPHEMTETRCATCGLQFVHRPTIEMEPDARSRPEPPAPVPPTLEDRTVAPSAPPASLRSPRAAEQTKAPARPPQEQGLTNGLVLEKARNRPVGLTNGLGGGRTNGLTNGGGRTNGLTNGIGRTNGLTNGTGRTNGLGAVGSASRTPSFRRRHLSRRATWKLCLAPLAIVVVLLLQLLLVSDPRGPALPIQIDGQFTDWVGVPRLGSPATSSGNANIDIVEVAIADNIEFLSLYIEVRGVALQGDASSGLVTDAFFVFLETDRSASTGYRVHGLGADRLIQIHGWGERVVGAALFEFDANRDPYDWGGWFKSTPAEAAVSGGRIELQVPWDGLVQPKAPVEATVASRGWDGQRDSADLVVTSETPYVVVSQDTRAPPVAIGTQTTIARITFTAVGGDVAIASLNVTLDGTYAPSTVPAVALVDGMGTTLSQGPPVGGKVGFALAPLVIPAATSVTVSVRPIVGVEDGTTVGAFVPRVRDVFALFAGVAFAGTAHSPASRAYVGSIPPPARVDGGFGEWVNTSADPTGDVGPGLADLDISRYAFQGASGGVLFHVQTAGEVLNGTLVPVENPVYTGGVSQPDFDRDGVPDALDRYLTDFNNDGTPDAATNGDYDADGVLDYGYSGGVDLWLNATIPLDFPAPYAGRPVSVFIGPIQRPVARGEDVARFYLDSDGSSLTGYQVGGVGADYLVEVSGKEGAILESSAARFNGTDPGAWSWTSLGPAPSAVDRSRLEASLPGFALGNGSRAFFEIEGWGKVRDGTAPTGPASMPIALATAAGAPPDSFTADPGEVSTSDIAGNQKWFFTDGATTGTGCTTNRAASTTPGAAPTSTTLTIASTSICWFTPTNIPGTFAGPWEVILDIDRLSDGTKVLAPDANGASNAWAVSGCAPPTAWQCVDDSPNDGDTSYIVSTTSGTTDSLFNILDWTSTPAPPSPLSIVNVVVEASCRKTGAPSVDVRILVRSSGTTFADGTAQDCANSATYTTWTETWTTDPLDGLPWTLADINALQVGVRDNDGFARVVRVSHVVATVAWTPVYAVRIDKCLNTACTSFTTLYGPTNGNTYGNDVPFTTPSIPAQTFTGNDRLRFSVTLYVDGASNTGTMRVRYNGPYPGTDDSRGTIAIPEFQQIGLPVMAILVVVPLLRRIGRPRWRRKISRGNDPWKDE